MIKSRWMRLAEHVGSMERTRNLHKILIGKSERKKPLGRPRDIRWDNIRMDPREIQWESVDWIHLTQDTDQRRALVNTVMNLQVPYEAGNYLIR
jgi:hypothetical protein